MSDKSDGDNRLHIKKYPNRRFYDATHSRHVTLPELHELICGGQEIVVHDAKSGADITNLVLTQIILERDADKLSVFPSNILHQVIRTQHELLGGVVEQYFRQTLDAYRASQERWADFLRNTIGAVTPASLPSSMNPLDWTSAWMSALRPTAAPTGPTAPAARAASEVDDLKKQLAELTRRIERLADSPD